MMHPCLSVGIQHSLHSPLRAIDPCQREMIPDIFRRQCDRSFGIILRIYTIPKPHIGIRKGMINGRLLGQTCVRRLKTLQRLPVISVLQMKQPADVILPCRGLLIPLKRRCPAQRIRNRLCRKRKKTTRVDEGADAHTEQHDHHETGTHGHFGTQSPRQ